jgi:uncharacterized membrane protein YedE/YeeE
MSRVTSLIAGIIFGIGLTISEMINPAKVLGFLNLFGGWDPSLAFVMIGALVITTPFIFIYKKQKPLFAESFSIPQKKDLDNKLIIGAVLFGAGWGLAGLCPGPAISSLALMNISSVIFVVAMFLGFYLSKFINVQSS